MSFEDQRREYMRKWRAANRDKLKIYDRRHRATKNARIKQQRIDDPEKFKVRYLRHKYGMTIEAFEAMRADQGAACASCRDPFTSDKTAHVDHCHATGKIRGLLCTQCNIALGHVRDEIVRLRGLIAYLEKTGP